MIPGKERKTELSKELEETFFKSALKKRELERLRERCESYQIGSPMPWSKEVLPAYSRYFGFLSALKVKSALQELDDYGYLNSLLSGEFKIIDFGAGTLGASLGAIDFLKERGLKPSQHLLIDQDLGPSEWGLNHFADFFPLKPKITSDFEAALSLRRSLFISVDVLNEMGLLNDDPRIEWNPSSPAVKFLEKLICSLDENSILLLLEPANKKVNRAFLRLRDFIRDRVGILLPCTHADFCPALKVRGEWCHEERLYRAPSIYWNLVHELGFERSSLQFSMLALGKQTSRFTSQHFRMVSRNLRSKGKLEKWFCGKGQRWKATTLTRFKAEPKYASFFASERGDILDSDSTGLSAPE